MKEEPRYLTEDNLKSLITELQKALDAGEKVVIWTTQHKNEHTKFVGTDKGWSGKTLMEFE